MKDNPRNVHSIATIERRSFEYFRQMADSSNGLVRDNSHECDRATVGGTGFALACYAVAAERGYVTRSDAVDRVLTALRFLWNADQSGARDATGYRGFFYHFLDLHSGRRAGRCEISTIDSGLAFAGALTAAAYFDRADAKESELRYLADAIYRRADWAWSVAPDGALRHGWTPERGFLPYGWCGYNEALFLYILALGSPSPTHTIPSDRYARWTSTYKWKRMYGHEFLYAGPLFIHQLSHVWIDFRGIQDAFMRARGIDYFENSRRAVYVQQEYAKRNQRGFDGYGELGWGITASNGPGPTSSAVAGTERKFYGYHARGIPYGADDGTLSPWAVAASLPFAPEIVLPTLRRFESLYPEAVSEFGYVCSLNPTFTSQVASRVSNGPDSPASAWISDRSYAIDQGPVVLMIENFRSALTWRLLRGCPYIVNGLTRAGFAGGWLTSYTTSADASSHECGPCPRSI